MRLKTQAVSAYRQQSAVFHHSVDVAYQRPFGLILLIKLHIIPTLEHLHVHSENLLTSTLTVISRGNGLEAIPTRMRGNVSKLFRCSLNFSFLQNSPKSSMFNKRNSSQITGTYHLCLSSPGLSKKKKKLGSWGKIIPRKTGRVSVLLQSNSSAQTRVLFSDLAGCKNFNKEINLKMCSKFPL